MAVHHIDVQHRCPRFQHGCNLFGKAAKISRQNGWRKLDQSVLSQGIAVENFNTLVAPGLADIANVASLAKFQGLIDSLGRVTLFNMALVEAEHLTKIYDTTDAFGRTTGNAVRAVDDVSFTIEKGETLGLVGESGCGKSTLGRMLLRLIEPTSGVVRFDGTAITSLGARPLREARREMQIIFQDPFGSLDPRLTIEEIVTEPLAIHEDLGKPLLRQHAAELMRAVGLEVSILGRYPHEFSGGQRQRIGIARALALRPRFIVADEAVSALDVSVAAQIVNLLKQLQKDFGLTYLFISHSMPVVRYLSTRIAVMRGGKIVEIGDTEQITSAPKHEYTQELLRAVEE
jgi:ABC-type oligopeptide transport system ATPase subunit